MKKNITILVSAILALILIYQNANAQTKSSKRFVPKRTEYGSAFVNKMMDSIFHYQFHQHQPAAQKLMPADETMQRLEGINEGLYRTVYAYDENENAISQADYELDESGDTIFGWKSAYTYDENGYLVMEVYSELNMTNNTWKNQSKLEFTNDDNGNITLLISYQWLSNQWKKMSKVEYSYDTNGNRVSEKAYSWNASQNDWVYLFKSEYSYDENNNMIVEIDYLWDENNGEWINMSKYELIYDNNNNYSLIENYSWDESNNEWELTYSSKYDYTYDSNYNITLEIDSYWDDFVNEWVFSAKIEYSFDDFDNCTLTMYYDWDTDSEEWMVNSKDESTFNTDYSLSDLIYPFWFEGILTGMLTNWDFYSYYDGEWELEESDEFYYSEVVTDIKESKPVEGNVYPNPAKDFVVFNLNESNKPANLELIDILGKTVIKQSFSGQTKVYVNELQKGLYIYKLTQNGKVFSGKLIVE
ncbi:MAG TPA: T9SS type A sorting domain-containing protein [Bacteroidales bacterium]